MSGPINTRQTRELVLSHIRERQIERAEARSQSAPRRQGQVGHMFKVG